MLDKSEHLPLKENGTPYRVFLIEDSEFMTKTLKKLFRTLNLEVKGSGLTAFEGLQKLEQLKDSVDIITLDINMPAIDGITIIPLIKKINPEFKIVMISASASRQRVLKAIQAGANNFIVKPYSPPDVFEILNQTIHSPVKNCPELDNMPEERKNKIDEAAIAESISKELAVTDLRFPQKDNASCYNFYVIDDSLFMRKVLNQVITKLNGHVTDEASDVNVALKELRHNPHKCEFVLLETDLPVVDGITVIPLIKKISSRLKIIMVSAITTEEIKQKCLKNGAIEYIEKPFTIKSIYEKINPLLQV